jgi:hypothetical protein
VARQEAIFNPVRTTAANDAGTIAAPTTLTVINGATAIEFAQPPVTGVVNTDGGVALVIDANGRAGVGAATLQPMAWNEQAREWFNVGAALTLSAGGATRFVVANWGARWSYVYVTNVVGTIDLWVGMLIQTGAGARQ